MSYNGNPFYCSSTSNTRATTPRLLHELSRHNPSAVNTTTNKDVFAMCSRAREKRKDDLLIHSINTHRDGESERADTSAMVNALIHTDSGE